jgi:cysteine synthase
MSELVDTNVQVHRYDPRDSAKQRVARALLREGLGQGALRIPHQAIVEFVQAGKIAGLPESMRKGGY